LKTVDGISYAHNCHTCGKKIDTIGNEFCCPDCKMMNSIRHHFPDYVCYWGTECKICTKAYKTNGSNYNDYELESDEIEEDEETYDDLEYSDLEEEDEEEEPLLLLKNPRDDLSKPKLERSSINYISSDEEDSLLFPIKVKTNQIQSLAQCDNTDTNVFQENIIDLMMRLYGQPNKGNQ
jgi:NMD protein affecting ribosome stability and mRNA decay